MKCVVPVLFAFLSLGCASSSTHETPGDWGNACLAGEVCNAGLECFRGVCVPAGTDGGGSLDAGWRDATRPPRDADRPDAPVVGEDGSVGGGGASWRRGNERLHGIFPVTRGVWVVDTEAAVLYDADDVEIQRFSPGRPITAAVYDGTYLAIADRTVVTTLQEGAPVQTTELTQWCESAVIVPGHVFICGPENDWDRIFESIDLVSGVSLGLSEPYTYNGLPMRLVPGTSHFVTVTTSSSPSDYHLYDVGSGIADFVGESPYHGGFRVTGTYAFIGEPAATHLVTTEGILLSIFGEDCSNSFSSDCFVRDGDLGVLNPGDFYIAMTDDRMGSVYGAIPGGRYASRDCAMGCTVQEVDVETRRVTDSRMLVAAFDSVEHTVFDSARNRLLIGVGLRERRDDPATWEIHAVGF